MTMAWGNRHVGRYIGPRPPTPPTPPRRPIHDLKLGLPAGWSSTETAKGETVYVDDKTKVMSWEHPAKLQTQRFLEGTDL